MVNLHGGANTHAHNQHPHFDLLSNDDDVGRSAMPNPLNISGTPFNFNNT